MWDLTVSLPDHCLSFYLKFFNEYLKALQKGDVPFQHTNGVQLDTS